MRNGEKFIFSHFQGHHVTLTLGQGRIPIHHLKGLTTYYLWPKFHNSTNNSLGEMGKSSFFHFFKVTLWPWPWVKVIFQYTVRKVLSHTTFDLSFITLLLIVHEKWGKIHFFSLFQGHPVTLTLDQGHRTKLRNESREPLLALPFLFSHKVILWPWLKVKVIFQYTVRKVL